MIIQVEVTPQAYEYLKLLVSTGLFGGSEEIAAQRLIDAQLQDFLRNKTILVPTAPTQEQIKCLRCGSPRIVESPTMGGGYECSDCGTPTVL